MNTLDEKQLDMKVFMEVLGMANVMQIVIESLNLLLQMILSLGILSLSKESHLITYQSGNAKTQIDFILLKNRKWLKTSR